MAHAPLIAVPPASRRMLRLSKEDHLNLLAEKILGNLDDDRADVAITNLTHAVRVACGVDQVSPALNGRLDEIVARGGGFS